MKYTRREIVGIFLVLIIALLSLGAWSSFFDVTLHPDIKNILHAVLWFSFLGTFFFLGAIIWEYKKLSFAGAFFLFLPSLLFTREWFHILITVFSIFFAWFSLATSQTEIRSRIRFNFIHNVKVGSFTFILGLSLSLSSAYFASIRTLSWEELLPRFTVGESSAAFVFKTAGYFYPEYAKLSEEGMTVDGFLESLEKSDKQESGLSQNIEAYNNEGLSESLPALIQYLEAEKDRYGVSGREELAHELYLKSGRQQISNIAGKPITGEEKIADIFSYALEQRVIAALSAKEASQHLSPQILPFILALLVFLTLLPVGSLLSWVWAILGKLLFKLAERLRLVRVIKQSVEQDVLE